MITVQKSSIPPGSTRASIKSLKAGSRRSSVKPDQKKEISNTLDKFNKAEIYQAETVTLDFTHFLDPQVLRKEAQVLREKLKSSEEAQVVRGEAQVFKEEAQVFTEEAQVFKEEAQVLKEEVKSINAGGVVEIDELSVSDIALLNPISSILKYNVKSLYNHPLIKQYVIEKSCGLRRFIILLVKLVVYIMFVMSLTIVGFSTQKPWQLTEQNQTWTTHDVCANYIAKRNVSKVKHSTMNAAISRCDEWWYVALITLVVTALIEVIPNCSKSYFQKLFHHRWFTSHEHLDWNFKLNGILLFFTTGVFLLTGNWYCGILALLQAWCQIPSYLIRLPGGTLIFLVSAVAETAMGMIHLLLIYVAAIACVFAMVFGDKEQFSNWAISTTTNFAVITGEFNMGEMVENVLDISSNDSSNSEKLVLRWYRELPLMLFLVLVVFFGHIVLMNVFTGLAVGNVQEIQAESKNRKAMCQMTSVSKLSNNFLYDCWSKQVEPRMKMKVVVYEDYALYKIVINFMRKNLYRSSTQYDLTDKVLRKWLEERDESSTHDIMKTMNDMDKKMTKMESKLETKLDEMNIMMKKIMMKIDSDMKIQS